MEDLSSTAGSLLIATPAINDGNFDQSVILMLHHDPVGALGVVINRPADLAVDELLPRWNDLVVGPKQIFGGGPVEQNGFIGLAHVEPGAGEDVATVPSAPHLATIDLDADPTLAGAYVRKLRIFRGYAGWGPRQLDTEIRSGAWFVADLAEGDVFTSDPSGLCERVLRRQPGEVRWFANAPADPSVN